jgi:hypothetical protein
LRNFLHLFKNSLSCVPCKRKWVSVSLPTSDLRSPSPPAPGRPHLGHRPAESVFDRLEEILTKPALKKDGGEEEEASSEEDEEVVEDEVAIVSEKSVTVGGLGVAAHDAVLEHKWAEEQRVEQQRKTTWTLQRCNNHKVFTRRVIKHTDRGASVEKQTFTMSATPSDVRVYTNALIQLRRYDDNVRLVCRSELPVECSAEVAEILDLISITQKELDIVKRQARTVDEDKERMEMLFATDGTLACYQSRLHVIEFGIEWEQG